MAELAFNSHLQNDRTNILKALIATLFLNSSLKRRNGSISIRSILGNQVVEKNSKLRSFGRRNKLNNLTVVEELNNRISLDHTNPNLHYKLALNLYCQNAIIKVVTCASTTKTLASLSGSFETLFETTIKEIESEVNNGNNEKSNISLQLRAESDPSGRFHFLTSKVSDLNLS